MKKVKDILPSILYLLIFMSILVLISILILNIKPVKETTIYKKVIGEKVEKVYKLDEGVNFIGVDFNSKYTALRILKENPNVTLIGDYDDNEWENIVKSSSKRAIKGKNFKLKQFKGYIIISDSDTQITLHGRKYDRKIQYYFDKGLNLISTFNYETSSELLNGLKEKGINVLGVSTWSDSINSFNNLIEDNGNTYGNDIEIDKLDGVFLKIQ